MCPAGTWTWNGPLGMNSNWSNAGGGNWLLNGAAVGANQYPGMAGSNNDVVLFNVARTGPATLDVGINTLNALQFTNWMDTLTVNAGLSLPVSGGSFALTDGSTIALGMTGQLNLLDATASPWTSGSVTGGGAMAHFGVFGTLLQLTGSPGSLGVNMMIGKSAATGANGQVSLGLNAPMTDNLTLSGANNNTITVADGGTLYLGQAISAAGQQDKEGGLDIGGGHAAGTVAVIVNPGGTLTRSSVPNAGTVDQVLIAGTVSNTGGLVQVLGTDTRLHIAGVDGNGRSYWQQNAGSAQLYVQGANINADGTYQIDVGTVQFMAQSGATTDELDGKGLLFGNPAPTALTIIDSTPGTPGTVTIQGPVTLAANTTTTMNFSGANNTADLLDVQNGTLTLNGTLKLHSIDRQKPTKALNFFDDRGGAPVIAGNFTAITIDNIQMAQIANAIVNVGGVLYYQVTIT